jgi:hypothetical protein
VKYDSSKYAFKSAIDQAFFECALEDKEKEVIKRVAKEVTKEIKATIAENMLKNNFTIDNISNRTCLAKKEILSLKST